MTNRQEIVGPDLTKAEPIAAVIARLAPMRNGYSSAFLDACKASGMDVTVVRDRDGVDHLQIGLPADSQEDLRNQRYDGLVAQLKRGKGRRQQVIDHLNLFGRFLDNQRFASAAEWANAFLEHGGRLWVDPDGRPEAAAPVTGATLEAEQWEAFPLRRLTQRHAASMLDAKARADLAAHIRQHGKPSRTAGFTELTAEGRADA